MPKVGLKLRLRLGGELPLDLIPDLPTTTVWEDQAFTLVYDPGDADTVTLNAGDASDIAPIVGTGTLSNATPSEQPLYKTTSGFASGRNSLEFVGASAQKLYNSALPGLSVFDSTSAWTMAMNLIFTTSSVGCYSILTDTSSNLNNIAAYDGTIRQAGLRYRDASGGFHPQSLAVATAGVPFWYLADFDGVDTTTIETSFAARASATGASAVTVAIFDSLFLGGHTSLGHFTGEMGEWGAVNRKISDGERATLITHLASNL